MTKKAILELLIKSFGLEPVNVRYYQTDSCGGQYESTKGWEGKGIDKSGNSLIKFMEPDGFNMAVYEILRQGKSLEVKFINS